jgi:hypothetical protein
MRLISLPSKPLFLPYSEYNVSFQDNIPVQPQSSITLHSVVLTLDILNFRISEDNKLFQIDHNKTGFKNITLTPGSYLIKELSTLIERELIASITSGGNITSDAIGIEYSVSTVANKLKIEFGSASIVDFNASNESDNGPIYDAGTKSFSKPGGSGNDPDCWAYDAEPLSLGPGFVRATLKTNNKCIIGLIPDQPIGLDTLPFVDYTFAIFANTDTGQFEINNNGTFVPVPTGTVTTNAGLKMQIFFPSGNNGQKTIFVTYRILDGNDNILFNTTLQTVYDRSADELFPAFTLIDEDAELENIQYVPVVFNPFSGETNPNLSKCDSTLDFSVQPETGQFLGFIDMVIKRQSVAPDTIGVFLSDNQVKNIGSPTTLLVELTNFDLQCFDGSTGSRRSYLQLIDGFKIIDNLLVWTANYPIPIPLNNRFEFSMQDFNIRILDSAGTALKLNDQITITVSVD